MTDTTVTLTERAVAQFFDGRRFGDQVPANGAPAYQDRAAQGIKEWFAWSVYDERGTDEAIGQTLYRYIAAACGDTDLRGDPAQWTQAGAWLRSLITEHNNSLEESMTTITVNDITFPDSAPLIDDWREQVVRWVNDDTNDIQPGVDLQLQRTTWCQAAPSFCSTGDGKRFVSNLMFDKAKRLFPVKQNVTIQDNGDTSLGDIGVPDHYLGDQAVVEEVRQVAGQSRVILSNGWYVLPCHLVRTVHSVNIDEVARLREELVKAHAQHQSDIELIGDVFWREAADRQWCTEAEAVIAGLNEHLHVPMQAQRSPRKFSVRVETDPAMDCGYFLVTGVVATDEDDAIENVRRVLAAHRFRPSMEVRQTFSDYADSNGFAYDSVDEATVVFNAPEFMLTAEEES